MTRHWLSRRRRRLQAALAAGAAALTLAVILLVAGGGGEAERRPSPGYFGVNAQFLFSSFPPSAWPAHLDAIASSGIEGVRHDALWEQAEPKPPAGGAHVYDWARFDAVVAALAERRLRWLPIIDYSAPWAGVVPGDRFSAPRSDADFAAYARAFAGRYGRDGEYWRANPGLPKVPVTSYEIWNEPNHPAFWRPAPDARRYAELYLATREAIRSVDPDARVVVGGLVTEGAPEFVRTIYRHRPEARGRVDGVGLHPYGTRDDNLAKVVRSIASLRRTLNSLGADAVPIELTEIGWTTRGPYGAVSDARRAANFRWLADKLPRSDCGVGSVVAHTWVTLEQDPASREHWFGLYHPDATPTASGKAYAAAVGRLKREGVRSAGGDLRLCSRPK